MPVGPALNKEHPLILHHSNPIRTTPYQTLTVLSYGIHICCSVFYYMWEHASLWIVLYLLYAIKSLFEILWAQCYHLWSGQCGLFQYIVNVSSICRHQMVPKNGFINLPHWQRFTPVTKDTLISFCHNLHPQTWTFKKIFYALLPLKTNPLHLF